MPVRFLTECMRIEARGLNLPITFSTSELPCEYAGGVTDLVAKPMLRRVETTYLSSCRIVGSLSHLKITSACPSPAVNDKTSRVMSSNCPFDLNGTHPT